jgi:hypothetical protein
MARYRDRLSQLVGGERLGHEPGNTDIPEFS